MRTLIPTLTFATTLALATILAFTAIGESDPLTCADLLPHMATTMQALRTGASPTPDQRKGWQTWNAVCKDRSWQDQLAQTLPGGPPTPMVIDTPIYTPPFPRVPAVTRREYSTTTCRTFSDFRHKTYTTCTTY